MCVRFGSVSIVIKRFSPVWQCVCVRLLPILCGFLINQKSIIRNTPKKYNFTQQQLTTILRREKQKLRAVKIYRSIKDMNTIFNWMQKVHLIPFFFSFIIFISFVYQSELFFFSFRSIGAHSFYSYWIGRSNVRTCVWNPFNK